MKSSKSWKALLLFPAAVALVAAWVGFLVYQGPALGQTAGAIQIIGPLTRDNGAIQTLTAAQGPATFNSADQSGFNVTRITCVFRQTTSTGAPTSTFTIQNKDAASGVYYNLITSSNVTTPATTSFIAAGGDIVTTANLSIGYPVARTWRTSLTITSTATVTGTIGCSLQ